MSKRKGGKRALDDPFLDERSMELFGKPESMLQIGEREILNDYVQDWLHPVWKNATTGRNDVLEVTNVGQVRDPETRKEYKVYHPKDRKGRNLYPFIVMEDGYIESVYRLVARAHVPNPDNKPQVNHIDGNKWNSWYRNLEWVTISENLKHAYAINLRAPKAGTDNGNNKYTEEQIHLVCKLLQDYPNKTYKEISEITGVPTYIIMDICNKKNWLSISKDYEIPIREKRIGSASPSSKYTDEDINAVCRLLQDHPEKTFGEVAKITGIPKSTVASIYHKENWRYISDNYTFPSRLENKVRRGEDSIRAKLTEAQVREICKLLDDVYLGKTRLNHQQIADAVGVGKKFVDHIFYDGNWSSVSKEYTWYKAKFGK